MTLSPVSGIPAIDIAGTYNGNAYSSRLALIESFTVNDDPACNDPSKLSSGAGWNANGNRFSGYYQGDGCNATVDILVVQTADNVIDIATTVHNLSGYAWGAYSKIIQCFPQKDNSTLSDSTGHYTFCSHDFGNGCIDAGIDAITQAWASDQWALYPPFVPGAPSGQRTCENWVGRISTDSQQFIGIMSGKTPMLSGNVDADYRCLHSNPSIGPLANGEQITTRTRICLNEASAADLKNKLNFA